MGLKCSITTSVRGIETVKTVLSSGGNFLRYGEFVVSSTVSFRSVKGSCISYWSASI